MEEEKRSIEEIAATDPAELAGEILGLQSRIIVYEKRIKELESSDGWISVKDRLPGVADGDESEAVIFCGEDSEYVFMGIYSYCQSGWYVERQHYMSGVTHWRPRPTKPKKPNSS